MDSSCVFQESVAVLYSPAHALVFEQFFEGDEKGRKNRSSEAGKTNERCSVQLKAVHSCVVDVNRSSTLVESAHDIGGMSVFIFLFAKVSWFNRRGISEEVIN